VRVLVTGLGTFWGSRIAQALEQLPEVELVVGVDTREPRLPLTRTEFVKADPSYTILRRMVRATQVDTVLHTHLEVDSTRTSSRRLHEVNVIGTIPGKRPERIALATHYDTKRFQEFKFVGASDGASSTAAVLELARVLKNRQNEFTIELLFLDGEEAVNIEWRDPDNTYGSKYYVQAAKQAGTLAGLKALVLLDMVGDRDLDIRPDSNSARWLNTIVWNSAARRGYGSTFVPEGFTVEDDHLPFVEAGVASIDIIDLDYPQWHTAQDDLDHVSARSLQTVGDVVLDAWPQIEGQLSR